MAGSAASLTERAAPPRSARTPDAALARSPTVAVALVRGLLAYATHRGVAERLDAGLLRALGGPLDHPDHRVPAEAYQALFEACGRACADPSFGIGLGCATRVSHLGVLGFLLQSSRTVADALFAYERYQRAVGETLQLRLSEQARTLTIRLEPMHASAAHPQRVQAMAAAIHTVLTELAGGAPRWESASFEHLAPSSSSAGRLSQLLGVPVVAGPDLLRLSAGEAQRRVQSVGAEPELTAALRAQLDRRLQQLAPAAQRDRVVAVLLRRLSACARPQLAAVARELGLSPRTLQLRLAEEGCGFRQVVDEVAAASAQTLLRQGAGVDEVAHLLGFSDTSAFSRAFRRWTGRTPAQARRG